MRALVLLLAACGSSSNPADVPADHKLHDLGKDTSEAQYVRYGGKQVPLADIPVIADTLGLPVTGSGDVLIDVTIPKTAGSPDYRKASGTIALACTTCQIGDGKKKLKTRYEAAFGGDGIQFGRLAIERFEVKAAITAGTLKTSTFKLVSEDLEVEASLAIELALTFDNSLVEGCIRFRPTPGLRARDSKMHDLLMLTGAARGADGFEHVRLSGSFGELRRLAQECGPTATPPAPPRLP
jgi:type II secretion system protein N